MSEVIYQYQHGYVPNNGNTFYFWVDCSKEAYEEEKEEGGTVRKLYTDAPPAVLPPEMKGTHDPFVEGYNQCIADALALGAQPQEPVGSVMGNSWVDDDDRGENYWVEWVGGRFPPKGISLYTMPPAALPELEQDVKNIIGLLSENEWAEHCTKSEVGRDLEGEITRLHDMRAQPQRPVICPPVQYLSKYAADDGHCTAGKLVPNKRTELRDAEWREALEAAGVKWEVKP